MKEVLRRQREYEQEAKAKFEDLRIGRINEVTVAMENWKDPMCLARFNIYWTLSQDLRFPIIIEGSTTEDGKPRIVFRKG